MLFPDVVTGTILFGSSVVLTCFGLSGVGFIIGGAFVGGAVIVSNVIGCATIINDYASSVQGMVTITSVTSDMFTSGAPGYATGAAALEHVVYPNVPISTRIQGAALFIGAIVLTFTGVDGIGAIISGAGAIAGGTAICCATIINDYYFAINITVNVNSAAAEMLNNCIPGYGAAEATADMLDNRIPGYVPVEEAAEVAHSNVPPEVIRFLNVIVTNPYSPICLAYFCQAIIVLSAFKYI